MNAPYSNIKYAGFNIPNRERSGTAIERINQFLVKKGRELKKLPISLILNTLMRNKYKYHYKY